MYVYRDFHKEAGCYTVGFYTPEGRWESESDHETKEEAADRVHWLNGGNETKEANPFISHGPDLKEAALWRNGWMKVKE